MPASPTGSDRSAAHRHRVRPVGTWVDAPDACEGTAELAERVKGFKGDTVRLLQVQQLSNAWWQRCRGARRGLSRLTLFEPLSGILH